MGNQTTVVNIKYTKKFDVYIGRGSKWGNPYHIGRDGTREQVIQKYGEYICARGDLLNSLHELEGKVLGCFCVPLSCHGNTLIELIEEHYK